jgi:hypothetical protein
MTEAIADRDADLVRFFDHAPEAKDGSRHWFARSQNVLIEWVEADAGARAFGVASEHETMVVLLTTGAAIEAAGQRVDAKARSLCIVPPGGCSIRPDGAGACAVFASMRSDLAGRRVLNQPTYAQPDPRVAPIGAPYRRVRAPGRIEVIALDAVAAPADNPRIKMFQSATLSINWVEYAGPRDRTTLSPHSHADFEQCSLAAAGDFVHHFRVNWARNANLWREDRHVRAPSPSVAVIPVHLVHTTEGIGAERHLLIDVFSPPRRDFIARGWMTNAADYEPPARAGGAQVRAPYRSG